MLFYASMLNLGRWNSTEPVNNQFHYTYPVYVTIILLTIVIFTSMIQCGCWFRVNSFKTMGYYNMLPLVWKGTIALYSKMTDIVS